MLLNIFNGYRFGKMDFSNKIVKSERVMSLTKSTGSWGILGGS